MAEIIPFGRPKPARTHRGEDPRKPQQGLYALFEEIERTMGAEFGLEPVLKIKAYLSSLRGRVSRQSIATARINLEKLSLEELRDIARNSTEAHWKSKPGYFQALVDEISSRS